MATFISAFWYHLYIKSSRLRSWNRFGVYKINLWLLDRYRLISCWPFNVTAATVQDKIETVSPILIQKSSSAPGPDLTDLCFSNQVIEQVMRRQPVFWEHSFMSCLWCSLQWYLHFFSPQYLLNSSTMSGFVEIFQLLLNQPLSNWVFIYFLSCGQNVIFGKT